MGEACFCKNESQSYGVNLYFFYVIFLLVSTFNLFLFFSNNSLIYILFLYVIYTCIRCPHLVFTREEVLLELQLIGAGLNALSEGWPHGYQAL